MQKLTDEDEKLIYNLKYYPGEPRHEKKLRNRLERGRKAIERVCELEEICKKSGLQNMRAIYTEEERKERAKVSRKKW